MISFYAHCIRPSLLSYILVSLSSILVEISSSYNFIMILSLTSSLSVGICTLFSPIYLIKIFNLANSASHYP
jgi:hypothetical protein